MRELSVQLIRQVLCAGAMLLCTLAGAAQVPSDAVPDVTDTPGAAPMRRVAERSFRVSGGVMRIMSR